MKATIFNPAQLQILDMLSFVSSSSALSELNSVISDYFARQAQAEIDRLWETGELNEEKVESFRNIPFPHIEVIDLQTFINIL